MKIIQPISSQLNGILALQKFRVGEIYRLMPYVVQQEVSEGLLLYNNLTKCMVLCQAEELNDISPDNLLIQQWFLVPMEHDGHQLCQQLRNVLKLFQREDDYIDNYCIFTTTACNARCFYCIQQGSRVRTMTAETAQKTVDFIVRHAHGRKVFVRWFWGEPLCNQQAINIISKGLQEHGVEFVSEIVSNGYLFDEQLVAHAKKQWHLKHAHITIDGTEQTYNRIKNYTHHEGSAYQRVMRNISLLLDARYWVRIRLNIDAINIDDMTRLVDEIHSLYGHRKNLQIYTVTLAEHTGKGKCKRTHQERAQLCEQQEFLERRILQLGYGDKNGVGDKLKTHYCKADSPHNINIMPNGTLGKCDAYLDSGFVGTIENDVLNQDATQKYQELRKELVACRKCVLYPDCFRYKKCKETAACYVETRKLEIFHIRQKMLNTYQKYLNAKN